MTDFIKGVPITTPVGVFKFPILQKPSDKFTPGKPKYECKITFAPDECKDFVKQLEGLWNENLKFQAALAGGKKLKVSTKPWRDEKDKDGNPTGRTEVSAKTNAQYQDKSGATINKRIKLFEADGKPFERADWISSGTKGRLQFMACGYNSPALGAGLTFRLNAAQIIDLVAGGGGTAETYGFSVAETPKEETPF